MAKQGIPKIGVQTRDRLGTRYAARLRKSGRLPAVVYGHGQDPVHVSLDAKEMQQLLHRNTHLLEMQIDSRSEPCLIKDVQWDHLGARVVHVDLARVDLTERVTVEVALELTGEPVGLKEDGAILEHPLQTIEVQCLATEIPESIKADVSGLNVGDAMTVADLKLPEGLTTTLDADTVIASISVVAEEPEEAEAPAEEGTEPEVIGKKEEEGEEGEAKPAKK